MILLAGGTAYADEIPEVAAPAPTFHAGNATTCSGGQFPAGLAGEILLEGGGDVTNTAGSVDVAADNKSLVSVTINDGYTASGIVVKGGNGYNLYSGPFVGAVKINGPMVAPPVGKDNTPTISHWFVCVYQGETPPPTTPPATTPPRTTPPATTTEPGLPVTGGSLTGIVFAGIALVGGGIALLFLRRRRAANETPAA